MSWPSLHKFQLLAQERRPGPVWFGSICRRGRVIVAAKHWGKREAAAPVTVRFELTAHVLRGWSSGAGGYRKRLELSMSLQGLLSTAHGGRACEAP
jgi:hypothetical protein